MNDNDEWREEMPSNYADRSIDRSMAFSGGNNESFVRFRWLVRGVLHYRHGDHFMIGAVIDILDNEVRTRSTDSYLRE